MQSLLLALILPSFTSAFLQNAICPQCSSSQYGMGSYGGYSSIDPNPLAYFNGPTDFGNQLGKAIAARINTVDVSGYSSNSPAKLTFGSYPTSSYGTQTYGGTNDYGGQTYVVQPDLYQQQGMTSGGYSGAQGYGNQGAYTFNSFPTNNYGQYGGQAVMPNNYNLGNYGNMATGYGNMNGFGNYATGGYGIPDPITTGGVSSSGGSCPYCFGNKGGFQLKKAKRESKSTKEN